MGPEDGSPGNRRTRQTHSARPMREYEETILHTLGMSLTELKKTDEDAAFRKLADEVQRGDAELEAKMEKWKALGAQREVTFLLTPQSQRDSVGVAHIIGCFVVLGALARLLVSNFTRYQSGREVCVWWGIVSISIYERGGVLRPELIVGHKTCEGRPTVNEWKKAFQVAMAFPDVGKPRRPAVVFVAWRMRDQFLELAAFLSSMQIAAELESREEAARACAEHGTDIEGRNHPEPLKEVYVPPPAETFKDEGNAFFACKRYAQAIQKYTEAVNLDPEAAVLYSNRALTYLRMHKPKEALADAEKAIKLEPTFVKGHARKADAVAMLGRVEEAKALYRACIDQFKNNAYFKVSLLKLENGCA